MKMSASQWLALQFTGKEEPQRRVFPEVRQQSLGEQEAELSGRCTPSGPRAGATSQDGKQNPKEGVDSETKNVI